MDKIYYQSLFNYSEDDLPWTIGFWLPNTFLLTPSHLSSVIVPLWMNYLHPIRYSLLRFSNWIRHVVVQSE